MSIPSRSSLVSGTTLCLLFISCSSIGITSHQSKQETDPGSQSVVEPLPELVPELIVQPVHILTDQERDNLDLLKALLRSPQRLELNDAADPVDWMTGWWEEHDPTPGTTSNEALEAFQLRATWLRERFPGISLSDLQEPWKSFLSFGQWDEILTGHSFIRTNLFTGHQASAQEEWTVFNRLQVLDGKASHILIYQVPFPLHLSLLEGAIINGGQSLSIPPLEGVWDLIEHPEADLDQRREALRALSWYELPKVAERLLSIPDSDFNGLQDELDACRRRLTVRRAYCLGMKGAQRLAAITAAGADTRLQLSRTLVDDYPAHQWSNFISLHPALQEDPAALLRRLELQFSSDLSITGWDWRGDLSLVCGPPSLILESSHTAYYAFGEPVSIQVVSGLVGTVSVVQSTGPIERYTRDLQNIIEARRTESQTAADNLLALIPEAASVSDSLIVQLNRLIPPPSHGVQYSSSNLWLDITADVISFPNRDGSIEIFASLGIPFTGISLYTSPSGFRTSMETSCVLYDGDGELIESIWHNEGFNTNKPDGDTKNLYLVDSFNFNIVPGEYLLYCSVRDPMAGQAAGQLFLLDLHISNTRGPVISPIALAAAVESGDSERAFSRGEYQLVPYPGRSLLFTEKIMLYTEISQLQRSNYGSYSWQETYYIIPAQEDMGIISFSPGYENTLLRSHAERYIEVDLSTLEGNYSGPIYIVVMITDAISGRSALAAAYFNIFRP